MTSACAPHRGTQLNPSAWRSSEVTVNARTSSLIPADDRAQTPTASVLRRAVKVVAPPLVTATVVAGGTVAVVLLVMLAVLSAPLAVALLGWVLWQTTTLVADGRRARAAVTARAGAVGAPTIAGR